MKLEIDGLDVLTAYKLHPLSWQGQFGRAGLKQMRFVSYFQEGYQVTKANAREYAFRGVFECSSYADLKARVEALQAVLVSPGVRSVELNGSESYSVFVPGGFQISDIYVEPSRTTAVIEAKFIQASETAFEYVYAIIDEDNNLITDENGDVLIY